MLTTTAYRDPFERARARLDELVETLSRTEPVERERQRIIGIRAARAAFGVVGILGAALLVPATFFKTIESGLSRSAFLTNILLGTWCLAFGAYAVTRVATAVRRPSIEPILRGSLFDDIERLTAEHAARLDGRILAARSLQLPAMAISLLAPLTIHFAIGSLATVGEGGMADFDGWIAMSLLIVGHAHIVLAIVMGRHAKRVATGDVEEVRRNQTWGFGALGWAVLAGAIPGVLLFAIPPLLVAVTGVLFVPLLWTGLRRVALREREGLELSGLTLV